MTDVERCKYTKAIWAAARENNVDRDGVYEAIKVGFSKTSVLALTKMEAQRLITGLRGGKQSANFSASRRRAMGGAGRKDAEQQQELHLCNEREHKMLREIASQLGWDSARLQAFCRRQIKRESPLSMAEFNKVLWALKAMTGRERRRNGSL
jgi:hypothetical protein